MKGFIKNSCDVVYCVTTDIIISNHKNTIIVLEVCYLKRCVTHTVEPVYIEHSQEMKKCSMYAGVQCIQVLNIWRSVKYKRN